VTEDGPTEVTTQTERRQRGGGDSGGGSTVPVDPKGKSNPRTLSGKVSGRGVRIWGTGVRGELIKEGKRNSFQVVGGGCAGYEEPSSF